MYRPKNTRYSGSSSKKYGHTSYSNYDSRLEDYDRSSYQHNDYTPNYGYRYSYQETTSSYSLSKSYLSKEQVLRIKDVEREIAEIRLPKRPLSAFQIFENKTFNLVKKDMPHLSSAEIADLIYHQWKFKLTDAERQEFVKLAKDTQLKYSQQIEEALAKKNALRKEIYEIKYAGDNLSVKPSGKLKYMSAFRFFRRELVPLLKTELPEMDGKERQTLIKDKWKLLDDN